jgi:hypothetical protein
MTTVPQLRGAALALPEVEEGTHFGMVTFSVRGKGLTSVTKGGRVRLRLPREESDAALAAHPAGEPLVRGGTPIGFRVPLSGIKGKDPSALVRAAWFSRAPKRLAASLAAAQAAAGSPSGLPAGIGRPATQAQLGAGVTTLEQVEQHSRAELLAPHGVGPKAVRVPAEALEQRGLALRG